MKKINFIIGTFAKYQLLKLSKSTLSYIIESLNKFMCETFV